MEDGEAGQPQAQPARPAAAYPPEPNEPTAPGPPPSDGTPLTALERLLWIHPFTSLYKHSGVEKSFREWLCFYLDAFLLLVVYLLLLIVIAVLVWKLVYPVPALPRS